VCFLGLLTAFYTMAEVAGIIAVALSSVEKARLTNSTKPTECDTTQHPQKRGWIEA
jgi:hypothetical protein